MNTQFNYIDVGVNVDITPRVHGPDEVSLKIAMDISAVDSYQNIGGIQQPVIGQRKIEQEIRMREGEANIMGGILEETDTRTCKAFPDWPRFLSSATSSPARTSRIRTMNWCSC